MGYEKDRMIQEQEQGWHFTGDKYVCASCFDDYALKSFIENNAEKTECSYCGATSGNPIAAHMDEVMDLIMRSIKADWTDPANVLPYESAEGGYQGAVYDTNEVFDYMCGCVPSSNESVIEEILESIGDQIWCKRRYYSLDRNQELEIGWEEFCELVKHHTRFMFFSSPQANGESSFREGVHPSEMLDELGSIVTELALTRPLPVATTLVRARCHKKGVSFSAASDLGPPPHVNTLASRMSPAGIPMFYGAIDEPTALAETRPPGDEAASIGLFETLLELKVLDLTNPPSIPSVFDEARRHIIPILEFLREFVGDVTKPIEKDGREHTEYVPTQIVTEFFRHKYRGSDGKSVQGILYPSAKLDGGRNCVLFCDSENCCDAAPADPKKDGKWLRLQAAHTVVFS
jgi:hypothetical protein